jgi:hypothetical protein
MIRQWIRLPWAACGLIVFLVGWPSAAPRLAAEEKKAEWVVALGGVATGAVPSFTDGWQFQAEDTFSTARVSVSSEYLPVTSTGLQGMAQVWLPSGLGVFAELQQESQKLKSNLDIDLTYTLRQCRTCPQLTLSAKGRSDTERFKRDDKRVHLGAGYRVKIASNVYLEASGGLTRFTLEQTLARELDADLDEDRDCVLSSLSQRCTVLPRVETKEKSGDSAWGFNLGGGLGVFFSRYLGLGAGIRYSRGGAVELEGMEGYDEDGDEFRTKVKVRPGGLTAAVSLRVRF